MSTNKAPGIDNNKGFPFCNFTINYFKSLTRLFSRLRFPPAGKFWSNSNIKNGDHEIPNNNRLAVARFIESLWKSCSRPAGNLPVHKRRLTTQQCGNKKWNSTETALIQTTNSILQNIDKKELTVAVLLDMSKAFDSIDHDILLIMKLRNVGLSFSSIEWFKSYLSSRYQVMKIQAFRANYPLLAASHKGASLRLFFLAYTQMILLWYPNIVQYKATLMTPNFGSTSG